MATVIRESTKNEIYLPSWLLEMLNLHDGSIVRATVDQEQLRLEQLDRFLSLRGSLADDEEFDRAMEELNKAWESWPQPDSV
jgi:antitoxin component of MazEF toxin-antitoxin module